MNSRLRAAASPVRLFALVTGMAVLFGCGGGGGGNGGGGGTTPTVSISISPTSASVIAGATQQFTATVTGTSNPTVTWQVNGTAGGSASAGFISTNGLYTAPATVPNPATVTVSVVSQADTSKSASASVTITAVIAISLSPTSVSVATGGTQQFTATVTGTTNQAVTWRVNDAQGGTSATGTISSSGLYTAPATVPNPPAVTVSAVPQADTSKSASATVTISTSSNVSVYVSPTATTVPTGTSTQFVATVSGTSNTAVTWQVSGGSTNGTITTDGVYTAPAGVPGTGRVIVFATSSADTGVSAAATVTVIDNTLASNQQIIQVNSGPLGNAAQYPLVNLPYTNVTICVPNSNPAQCQTIYNVEVDTGSEGLQLLSSAVSLNLPPVTVSGNQLQECVQYSDNTYAWGPIVSADVKLAGETASNIPIQVIPTSPSPAAPSSCSAGGDALNTLETFGANGILGLGVFQQDCGPGCASASPPSGWYYTCPGGTCSAAQTPVTSQRQNPVWKFDSTGDNNGLSITLPSVAELGAESVAGTMTFGIGTRTNNGLNGAIILTGDPNSGDIESVYNSVTYGGSQSSRSFIDSGSNGYYILDATTLGKSMTTCSSNTYFYCPSSTTSYDAINVGFNNAQAPVSFRIADANALLSANNYNNWAFDDFGGTYPLSFDWGLPFFFGKTVFIGIEGQTTNGVAGPFWAY